jgi:hypothetical protein
MYEVAVEIISVGGPQVADRDVATEGVERR